jgi:hypothetical protein
MKARLFILFVWLMPFCALLGCAHGPKVEIPVPVTCQTPAPKEPDYQVVKADDGLYIRVQKLLANEQLHTAYEAQLKAWGEGCHT